MAAPAKPNAEWEGTNELILQRFGKLEYTYCGGLLRLNIYTAEPKYKLHGLYCGIYTVAKGL